MNSVDYQSILYEWMYKVRIINNDHSGILILLLGMQVYRRPSHHYFRYHRRPPSHPLHRLHHLHRSLQWRIQKIQNRLHPPLLPRSWYLFHHSVSFSSYIYSILTYFLVFIEGDNAIYRHGEITKHSRIYAAVFSLNALFILFILSYIPYHLYFSP